MKKEPQPLEIGDDESIDVHTNYEVDDPLFIEGKDPSKRYYFAANDGDSSRPDGVARVLQRGYSVSEKKHGSADCKLMEIDKDLWERRQARMRKQRAADKKELMSQFSRNVEKENGRFVRLRKDGGFEE